MTDRGFVSSADPYSPQRRTALVLTGTGTAGAYHAGVLRALHEAGVKIDVVGAHGVGVVGALFAAVDGTHRLVGRTRLLAIDGGSRSVSLAFDAALRRLDARDSSVALVAVPLSGDGGRVSSCFRLISCSR